MCNLLSALLLFATDAPPAVLPSYEITVTAGKQALTNAPIRVPLDVPTGQGQTVLVRQRDARALRVGQLIEPALYEVAPPPGERLVRRDLVFVLDRLDAGRSATFTVDLLDKAPADAAPKDVFAWDQAGDTLSLGKAPVLRYEHPKLDESTPEKREATFKVFHHVYSPDGSRLVTKGVGGKYTHHRGLFYGFMKVTYGDNQTVDIWHCKGDTHQAHDKALSQEAGPVVGRQRVRIGWHGNKKELFAVEERDLTVFAVPGGRLIEFASKVTPLKGVMKVDGDPQHAGFHFRADNEVDRNSAQTIYIRPDGVGKPGETRNWDPKTMKGPVDLPWNAMSFVLGDKRYTAAYLDHPSNPKEARYSEREYGRFGSYFVAEATPEKPLVVRYRVWVQDGQMKPEEVAALSAAFVEPKVTVKVK
jgi:hypothetical protein